MSLDHVGPSLPCIYNGRTYWYILIFVSQLSKIQNLALASTQEVEEAVELFYQYCGRPYGLPNNCTSAQKSQFVLEFETLICQRLPIDARLSIQYYPETDAQTGQKNAVTEYYL